ncbi:hypothetical protein F4604DRAFT_1753315 [Suillus subluteus]|nr:hypothetical protein F4604DRAFT_1753315 [Suillus subluteus]
MITFYALYPPMMQPEPLAWMVDPSSLDEEAKILAVLKILRGLRMSVMGLILHSISQGPSMATWKEGFFGASTDERVSNFVSVYDPLLLQWFWTRLTPRWRPLNIFFTCCQKMSPPNYSSHLMSTRCRQSRYKKPLRCYVAFFCQLCRWCEL